MSKLGELYRYCLQDWQLSLSIWQALGLSTTVFATSWLCKSPIEFMASGSTGRAAETFVKGFAITSKQCAPQMAVRCGHVAEVLRGLHRQLYEVDVGSMYSSIMLNGMAGSRAGLLSTSLPGPTEAAAGRHQIC